MSVSIPSPPCANTHNQLWLHIILFHQVATLHTLHCASSIKCVICMLMQVVCSSKTPMCLIKLTAPSALCLISSMFYLVTLHTLPSYIISSLTKTFAFSGGSSYHHPYPTLSTLPCFLSWPWQEVCSTSGQMTSTILTCCKAPKGFYSWT